MITCVDATVQNAVDGLVKQISALAGPGSRLCFDALHRAYMDGRVRYRGYSCGSVVRPKPCNNPVTMPRVAPSIMHPCIDSARLPSQ